MKAKFKLFLTKFLMLTVVMSAPSAWANEKLDIALLPSISGDPAHLKIADIVDRTRTTASLIEKFGEISLPQVGGGGNLQPSHVLLALSRGGADLSQINLLTTAEVQVISTFRNDVFGMIQQASVAALQQTNGDPVAKVQVDFIRVPPTLPEKNSFTTLSVEVKEKVGDPLSRLFFVRFLGPDKSTLTTAELEGKIQQEAKVVVAKRPILKGEFVTASDFEETTRTVQSMDGYVKTLSELGQSRWQINEGLDQGALLSRSGVNFSSSIKKGSVVTLLTGNGRFQIRALGRVLEVMDNGASVLVENLDSKKELFGQPINASEVRIAY